MPKSSTASEMLSDLKSRLGFSSPDKEERQSAHDEGYGDYDDLDADGFSPRYDSEYAGYGADYDENAQAGGFQPASTRSGRFGRADSTPNLVSIDDVKSRTPLPDMSSASAQQTRRSGSRNLIDERIPAQSSPAYNASLRDRGSNARSEGLNSLFEPSGGPSASPARVSASATPAAPRGLSVIRPVSYNDAERVARCLKAGDVVVLSMRSTPANLVQRILDFSFGVASVLDANVESPAEKVFAIACGAGLSEEEKRNLRAQGVL